MNKCLSGLVLLVLVALYSTCGSGGGGDPLAADNPGTEFGGSLTQGGNGPNQAVTNLNRLTASQILFMQAYGAFSKSMRQLVTSSLPPGEMVNVSGSSYGHAETSGFASIAQNNSGGFDYTLEITLSDYSDDGAVFLGGKLDFSGSLHLVDTDWIPGDVKVSRGVAFAGQYRGSLIFNDLSLPLDSLGHLIAVTATQQELYNHLYDGSVTFRSQSDSLNFNPYFRVPKPPDSQGQ